MTEPAPGDVAEATRPRHGFLWRLFVHTSHYSLGNLLVTLSGFVSFPFLTRIFSVADYGLMNLISTSILLLVGLGKVGMQHSILRYHSELHSGRSRFDSESLYSTALLGMLGTGATLAAAWAMLIQLAPARWFDDARFPALMAFASVLVVTQVADSCLTNLLRAEQRSGILVRYQVAKKYGGLTAIIAAVLFVARDLWAFYGANVAVEAGGTLLFAFLLLRPAAERPARLKSFSPALFREMLRFGVPMMLGYELSGVILAVGDRYVIQALIGSEPLGIYSAAYNLCQYIQTVLIVSVGQAIVPIYMRLWDERGEAETQAFIVQSLRYYYRLGIPMIAGLAAIGSELLPFVASDKYASGVGILPWVIAGMVVDGATIMVAAGLLIQRRTMVIMWLVIGSAVLNIALNIVLIPRIGILGSAVATLVAYAVLSVCMARAGARNLSVALPWGVMAQSSLFAAVMYLGVFQIHAGGRFATILARVLGGVGVYAALTILADPETRNFGRIAVSRLRGLPAS